MDALHNFFSCQPLSFPLKISLLSSFDDCVISTTLGLLESEPDDWRGPKADIT